MGERAAAGPGGFLHVGGRMGHLQVWALSSGRKSLESCEHPPGRQRWPWGSGDKGSAVLRGNPGPTWGGGGSSGVAGSARPARSVHRASSWGA